MRAQDKKNALQQKDIDGLEEELNEFWQRGFGECIKVKKKKSIWEGLLVALIGAVQIIGGIAVMCCSFGMAGNIGIALIAEGVSDLYTVRCAARRPHPRLPSFA